MWVSSSRGSIAPGSHLAKAFVFFLMFCGFLGVVFCFLLFFECFFGCFFWGVFVVYVFFVDCLWIWGRLFLYSFVLVLDSAETRGAPEKNKVNR